MKFSYNWLRELVRVKESSEQLAEFLTLRAFEVESVTQHKKDWILDIKLYGNRMADASGHIGMAREIASLKKLKFREPNIKIMEKSTRKIVDRLKIVIEDKEGCSRYSARVMTGVRVAASPAWLEERLMACGLQSINNLVDAANYVMLERGQPLHVFDYDQLESSDSLKKIIIVRRAKKGEELFGLDEKNYTLDPSVLVIADSKRTLAIAGIKGGKNSGVSETTTNIILEAANFNSTQIRRTSQTLRFRTDASYRFENGLDPNETENALNRLVELILQIAGGEVLRGAIDIYPHRSGARKILFRADYANRILGQALSHSFYQDVFTRLGMAVTRKKPDVLLVQSPTRRRDIEIEEDLIEEAARIFGYENIKPTFSEVAITSVMPNEELRWEDRVRSFLTSQGFSEHSPYEFTGDRELEQFSIEQKHVIVVENPTSPEQQYLTPRVAIKYILAAVENGKHYDAVRLFGIGKNFLHAQKNNTQAIQGIAEEKSLVIVSTEKDAKNEEFYRLKGVVEQLLESCGLGEYWFDDVIPEEKRAQHYAFYHPYRVAEIKVGDTLLGIMGEIHPRVFDQKLKKGRIVTAEISFDALWHLARAEGEYQPPGKYPSIVRDIAVIVPFFTKTEEVLNIIENVGGPLLMDTDLFDYFQDEEMRDADQKSLAFHLVFQSQERTLEDKEINTLTEKIVNALEEKGWEVKK